MNDNILGHHLVAGLGNLTHSSVYIYWHHGCYWLACRVQPKREAANWVARPERDRLRQERKRRAAGISPCGAQEALEKATGWRDEFGRLNDSE